MEPTNCLDRLARRLREWRGERGLTLQQLAQRSGVAASTIHKIEVRKTVPTVAVLCRIANGLERPVTDFLEEDPAPTAQLHRRADALAELEPGLRVGRLGEAGGRPRGYRVTLAAGGEPTKLQLHGELSVVCEEGALQLVRDDARHELAAGDVLALHSPAPACVTLRATAPCRLLLLGDVPETPRALLARGARAAHRRAPAGEPWRTQLGR